METVEITAIEGLKDTSTGRLVQVGDVLDICGYILPNGQLCAEKVTTVDTALDNIN